MCREGAKWRSDDGQEHHLLPHYADRSVKSGTECCRCTPGACSWRTCTAVLEAVLPKKGYVSEGFLSRPKYDTGGFQHPACLGFGRRVETRCSPPDLNFVAMGPDASRGVAKGTRVVGGCHGVDLSLNYFLGLALSRCRSISRVPAFGVRGIKSHP